MRDKRMGGRVDGHAQIYAPVAYDAPQNPRGKQTCSQFQESQDMKRSEKLTEGEKVMVESDLNLNLRKEH